MSAQLLSSKVVTQEEPPSLRTIQNVATGVVACVGITAKGPVGVSTLLTSFEQFVGIFGGDIASGFATSAARGFFAGGGQRMYFTRIVHYTDITVPTSKTSAAGTLNLMTTGTAPTAAQVTGINAGPFALVDGDTLTLARNAAGNATATFHGTAGSVKTTPIAAGETYALANGDTLALKIDDGTTQTFTFLSADFIDITEATATEIRDVINATLTGGAATIFAGDSVWIDLVSASRGTGSKVEITGGSVNVMAMLPFDPAVDGTGNAADLSAVTVAEIKAIVETAVTGVVVSDSSGHVRITSTLTGPTSMLQVIATSSSDDELGLDNTVHSGVSGTAVPTLQVDAKYDGVYSSNVTVLITPATSGVATEFNLAVLSNGNIVERFPNLSMLDSAMRYVATMVNAVDGGSKFIQVTDLDVNPGGGAAAERPANGSGSPAVAFGPLVGGSDGLVGLADVDFVGDASSHLGFNSFDLNDDVDVLICPERATPAVHNAALSYTSVTRNGEVFFIADSPAGLSPAGIVTYVEQTAAILNLTEDGAIYWPRVKVLNPNASVFGSADTIVVPPCGHIAGMYARTDSARVGGVFDPPGGVEKGLLPGVVGFENEQVLDENVRDLIAPKQINPITRLRGQPIACDDVMTLKAGGAFPTIAERRGVSFIERSIKDGIQFARIRNNDESLRDEVDRTITGFLIIQMKLGAFRSKDPEKAFYVDVGEALNPPTEQFAGRLNARIGLATQKPSRFLILSFAQDTRAIDEEIAAAG